MTQADPELKRAEALLDVGRVEEARQRLATVVAAEPANAHALCLLASCHAEGSDMAASLAAADRAVAAEPGNEWGHRLRANALLSLSRAEEAVAAAEEAVRLAPDTWAGCSLLGAALSATSRRRAARAAFLEARRLAPFNPDVHLVEGRVYHAAGARWRARRRFRRALSLDPQSAVALESLGAIALAEGRLTAAIRHVRAATATAPGSVAALEYLDRAVIGMLGWAIMTLWAVMLVLTFSQFAIAWLVAAGVVAAYAVWAWRGWRALPSATGQALWHRARQDPRMVVRVVGIAVAAAVAAGIGATAAGLDYDDPPFAQLLALFGTVVVFGAAIGIVDWRHARPRDQAEIEAARAGTPTPSATIDLEADADAAAKLLAFRWYQAALVPAIVLFVPAIDETPDWPVRALLGTALLAAYGVVAWRLLRRVRAAPAATIARWHRARAVPLPFLMLALLALVVFMLGASYLPDGNALLVGLLAVAAFVAILFGALIHAVLGIAALLRLRGRLLRRGGTPARP
jgi:tetratricopeptide (TPR) repeat protein